MSVRSFDSHPVRRYELLIPASARDVIPGLGGSIAKPDSYSLRRCKEGAIVWLHCGPLSLDLTLQMNHLPGSYAEARQWMRDVEARFEISIPERKKACRLPAMVSNVVQFRPRT